MASLIGTPDWQRGVYTPQKLIGKFTTAQLSETVTLPPNCESLLVVVPGVVFYGGQSVQVVGTTTNGTYPAIACIQFPDVDQIGLFIAAVSPAADPAVTVTLTATPSADWYVVADAGVRGVVDYAGALAIAIPGSSPPVGGIQTMGFDGIESRPFLVNKIGETYVVPTVPSVNTNDHPPNELQVVTSTNAGGGATILAATGAGKRYRVFFVSIHITAAGGAGALEDSGIALWGGTGSSTSEVITIDYKPTGIAMTTNSALVVANAGVFNADFIVVYTTETV